MLLIWRKNKELRGLLKKLVELFPKCISLKDVIAAWNYAVTLFIFDRPVYFRTGDDLGNDRFDQASRLRTIAPADFNLFCRITS